MVMGAEGVLLVLAVYGRRLSTFRGLGNVVGASSMQWARKASRVSVYGYCRKMSSTCYH